MNSKKKLNEYSFAYGILCFSVIYIHLNIVPKGFDTYSWNINSALFTKFLHIIISFTVPTFFMLWGFLSGKYLSTSVKPFVFFKTKIVQFWPLYILFSIPVLFNIVIKTGPATLLPIHSTILAVLGFGNFFGSHIMMGLFFSISVIAIVKSLPKPLVNFTLYSISLIITSTFIPEGSTLFKEGIAFHTAFCAGVTLYHFNYFQPKSKIEKGIVFTTLIIGAACFFSTLFYKSIIPSDFPNSPGHTFMSLAATFGFIHLIKKFSAYIPKSLWFYICIIGNAAFAHLVIHLHVMNAIVTISEYNKANPILVQIFLFTFTSPISIFLIYYPYLKIKSLVLKPLYGTLKPANVSK